MAKPVGDLVVRIGADISGLRSGVANAQSSLARLGGAMRTGINIAAKLGAAATAAGVALVGALVKKTMDAIDEQSKLARQLRTSNLALETLTRGASLAGIEKEKMTMAVKRLDVAIGESIRGTKTYADAFDKLGMSAETIASMDADQRIMAINEALNATVPVAERAQVAGVLFGTRVAHAVSSIDPDTLKAAREEVEALGLAVSEVDSLTIERAGDAMSVLGETLRGVMNRITVKLAPVIELIAQKFRSAAIESKGFGDTITAVFSGVMTAVGRLGDVLQGLRVVFKGLELIATGFGAAVVSVIEIAAKAVAAFIDNILAGVNSAISALNKLPKVDIGLIDSSAMGSGIIRTLDTLGESMRDKVGAVRSELHELAMQEMPSDKIKAFLAEVEAAAAKTSEAMIAAHNARTAEVEGGGDGVELEEITLNVEKKDEAEAERRVQLAERLAALRETLMSETELEKTRYAEKLELLRENLDAQLVTETDYRTLEQELAQQHQDKLTEIEKAGLTQRQQFEQASMQQKVKMVSQHLANLTAGVAQHSRKMFELNKVAGIANAIVNAYEGISLTMKSYPYPLNVGMAAAHAAAAFAQVSAIKSASFTGSGGTAPSLAGSTPATPVTPVTGGIAQQPQRLHVEGINPGDIFSGTAVRELFERLKEHMQDGGEVLFT